MGTASAGLRSRVGGQPRTHSETLSEKRNQDYFKTKLVNSFSPTYFKPTKKMFLNNYVPDFPGNQQLHISYFSILILDYYRLLLLSSLFVNEWKYLFINAQIDYSCL